MYGYGMPPHGGYGMQVTPAHLPPGYVQPGYAQAGYAQPGYAQNPMAAYTWNNYGSNLNLQQVDNDCTTLRQAMKGLGTDENTIINVLTQRNNEQRYMMRQRYQALFQKDLIKELKSELHGHFEDAVIALLDSPYELDCRGLYHAMHRPGTDEKP